MPKGIVVIRRPQIAARMMALALDPDELVAGQTNLAECVAVPDATRVILAEPDDEAVVAYAVAAGVSWLVTTKPEGLSTAYDPELMQPDVIQGTSYPAPALIREELKAVENRAVP